MTNEKTICGKTIQHDPSGVGHAWRHIAADEIPADVAEFIAGEIIDGHVEHADDFAAPNGLHYRW